MRGSVSGGGGATEEFKSGKFKSSHSKNIGLYPFYNGKAIQPDGYTDNFCYDSKEYIILIKDGGAGVGKYGEQIGLGNVFLVKGKSGFTSHQVALEQITTIVNNKYLYYILKTNKNNIMDLANYSTGLGTINKNDLTKFKIKIPKNKQLIEDLTPTFNEIEKLNDDLKESEELYKQLIKELSEEAIPTVSTLIVKDNVNIKKEEVNEQETKSTTSSTSSIKSLQEQCKSLGIKGYSKYKKKEDKDKLIKLIEEHS